MRFDVTCESKCFKKHAQKYALRVQPMLKSIVDFVSSCVQEYDGSHDVFHAHRVASNVMRIAATSLDYDDIMLAVAGAFLHDTCDPKYNEKAGALRRAEAFLSTHFLSDEVADIVAAINKVSFTRLKLRGEPVFETNRAFALWSKISDADMLEALGAVGTVRTLLYQGYKEKNVQEAIDYMASSLLQCDAYITNDVAKTEARRRAKTMQEFVGKWPNDPHLTDLANVIMTKGSDKVPFDKVARYVLQRVDCAWFVDEFRRELQF